MTNKQYEKIWVVCGLLACLYAANSWLVTQQGNQVFNVKLFVEGRAPTAWAALFVVPLLVNIGIYAGRRYAALADQKTFAARVPAPFIGDFSKETGDTIVYRSFWLFVLCAFPVLSLLHFVNVAMDGTVCLVKVPEGAEIEGLKAKWGTLFWNNTIPDMSKEGYWLADECRYVMNESGSRWRTEVEEKVSWYPLLSPALSIIVLGTFLHATCYIVHLLKDRTNLADPRT